ncbi:Peptidase of plants and bacteria [Musa troglodytarum]|uniref:Peptidase of plants and bacteria n=1 Tax=Musa troglodytarum TaxID=320322 RepID=A0A9E7JCJ3_9LILI|nr:Peptidase of plants and bacteria [Musa troglodytarum]
MKEPLLSSPTTASSLATTPAVLIRVTTILTLVAVSLWANYEASTSVDISVVNSADGSRAGRLFDLKFASNGRAHRIIHHASQFVEQVLYPDERYPRKPINRITLRLAGHDDLPFLASVSPGSGAGDYTIHVSPILMSAADADAALAAAVHRAVAKLWLWDGQRTAPEPLLEAAAEYLATAAGFGSRPNVAYAVALESNGTCWSAEFLRHCEAKRDGFVAGLNRGMQERWTELTADEAFGSPVQQACAAYRSAPPGRIMESSNSTTDSVEARLST